MHLVHSAMLTSDPSSPLPLQLLMDHGYSVVHADQDGQKPLDWADAMNQTVCVRYLMMYEACWALSAEVTHMSEQIVM